MVDQGEVAPSLDYKGFLKELQQESPRSAVILGAAFLDAKLRQLIANYLIDDQKYVDRLLGTEEQSDTPLSSFTARIRASYCLGLISKEQCEDLLLIRFIRNEFAHKLHDLSFDDLRIRKKCDQLRASRKVMPSKASLDQGDHFIISVALLSSELGLRALWAKRNRLLPFKGYQVSEIVK
jgi:DNA-binding MltR family transcriptional regulator